MMCRTIAPSLEPFAMQGTLKVHNITQDRGFVRRCLGDKKATSVMTLQGVVNMLDACETCQKYAHQFNYSFLMMLGSLDEVVSNPGALKWFGNTPKSLEKEKVEFKGFVH